MQTVKPFIPCIDYWPEHIPEEKLAVYRQLIDEGQIRNHHVVYNQRDGSTAVAYYAIAPHEWILEELKRRCESGPACIIHDRPWEGSEAGGEPERPV